MNSIDELNGLNTRSIPYEQYFGEMDLTKQQKEERIAFSEKMEDVMLFIFALIGLYNDYNMLDKENIVQKIKDRYMALVGSYIDIDSYLEEYIDKFSFNTLETTLKNLDKLYYLSKDRAMYIAENEANTILNYKDFLKAIMQGKTKKTWVDMKDKRERKTHIYVGGKTIPIMQPFVVGKSLMLFAKDTSLGASASEIVNCRCKTIYK